MSSADERPFLAAILARPHDDGPRLVYADFLDDAGGPADAARADLVRVQVALARLPDDHPRRPELADRQTDLLRRHRAAWAAPLAGLAAGVGFRRGVMDAVSVEAAAFVARGGELFARTRVGDGRSFVRRVRLLDPARALPALAECPFLAEVEELDLSWGDLGNDGVTLLARSPHLGRVRALDLGCNGLDDAGVRALAGTSALPGLESLTLNDNGQITSAGVRAVAESPFLAGLTDLDLSGNDVNDDGVRAALGLPRLRELKLAGNPVGDAGIAALVGATGFARMLAHDPRLDLRACAVGPAGAEALAASRSLARVVGLDLGGNDIGDRGARALAGCGRLANLRVLGLARNQIADAGALALAAGLAALPRLRELDLSGNRLTRRGAAALRAAAAGRDIALDLAGNGTEPSAPVAVADVVTSILVDFSAAEVADLRRRVAHPSRRN